MSHVHGSTMIVLVVPLQVLECSTHFIVRGVPFGSFNFEFMPALLEKECETILQGFLGVVSFTTARTWVFHSFLVESGPHNFW